MCFIVQGKQQPTPSGKSLMCAYKLCRVEFRYWGVQTKLEKFIHDIGQYTTHDRYLFTSRSLVYNPPNSPVYRKL